MPLLHYSISDSEGETPKKKTKATPPKKVGKSGKGGKSPAPAVKKQIKSAADFFGSVPVQRSKALPSGTRGEKRRADVRICTCTCHVSVVHVMYPLYMSCIRCTCTCKYCAFSAGHCQSV